MAIYDTYKPFVIGNQFVPLVNESTVVDTGVEVGYRFIATEDFYSAVNGSNWLSVVTTAPPPGVASRSEIVCRLYKQDPLDTCTPLKTLIIPCSSESDVVNPSDPSYVRLSGASQTARFWFDPTAFAAVLHSWDTEIVDVSVIYAISGPFATATTNTMSCGLERQTGSIKRYMDYLITGPDASSSITALKRSRFGELCPFWDSGTNPNTEPMRGPWVYQGYDDVGLLALAGTGTDNVAVFFETGASAAGDFDIQYVGLQVTYRENFHLIGVGGIDLSGGAEIPEGLYTYRCPLMPADLPWAYTSGGGISTLSLSKGNSYIITVSRAYSGSVSVSSPTPIPLSMINTIDSHVPDLLGVRITKPTAEGAVPVYSETTQYPAIVIYGTDPLLWATEMIPTKVNPACHAYEQQMPQTLHDVGTFYSEQQIPNDTAGTFVWATFYARASASVTGALFISQTDGAGTFLGPEGTIDYATWIALPEIVDGWRKVTVTLSPVAILDGAGGVTYWQFWTSSNELMVWEVLGATANHTVTATGVSSGAVGGYYGETAIANFQGAANYPLDMTLTLAQEMTGVSSLTATQLVQALTVVDEYCNVSVSTIPTGIVYNHLTWDIVLSAMVSGWGYYEIQRRDTTMDAGVWETIAKITNPYVGEMDDYEARIGVQPSYRIRTVHATGIDGPWSAEIIATIAAPGVTGTGVGVGLLVFTSNEDPSANLAYVHIHGGDPEESFDFIESGQGSLEPTYGRDYQVALRPVERGGVSFTRTILVNKVGIPTGTLDRGFDSLRDLAWDAIPYVCVRDELSNRWLANIAIPSGSIRRQDDMATYYQVSSITIAEVTATPYAHDDPRPFLGLESTKNIWRYADIASCAVLATLEDVDIRVKFIMTQGGVDWGFSIYRYDVGPPESSWSFSMANSDGSTISFYILGDDGFLYEDQAVPTPIFGQPTWARCVYDHDDGLGTSTVTFYTSVDGITWTTHATITAGPAGLVPSVGGWFYLSVYDTTIVQEMIVIDTQTGTTIMSPDFAAQTATTTSFADAQANTWNLLVW
jgi:hypothetical protein